MNNAVEIPRNLTDDEVVDFVRKAIADIGGDPNTAYISDISDICPMEKITADTPITFGVTFHYDN
jgi:hypothetical protein